MKFKDRLVKARLKAKLTQAQLAKMCKRSTNWVTQYECGNREPTIVSVKILMKALKLDANYFIK